MKSIYKNRFMLLLAMVLCMQYNFAQPQLTHAEYFIDTDPGEGNATALTAADGNFSDAFETVFNSGLNFSNAGSHTINIRVMDNTGHWSPVFTQVVTALNPAADIHIATAEYFVDADPGEGAANVMLAFDGNFSDAFETVIKSGLSFGNAGSHTISIRVKDNANHWSPVFTQVVTVLNSAADIHISTAEYFIDTDPGEGAANVMLAFDGNLSDAFETVIKSGLSFSSAGSHTVNIRVKDNANHWSPVFTQVVTALNPAADIHIATAEYFIDADPGEGAANAMLAFDGNFSDAFETVVKSGLSFGSAGSHTINIRVKDNANHWSPVFTQVITALNPAADIHISTAEYFIDADPGEGAANAMLAFDGNFNNALETVMKSGLSFGSAGSHTINIRVKDNANHWSPVFTQVVTAINPADDIHVGTAEYFYDNDPGEGNGTTMLAFSSPLDNAFETVYQNVTAPPPGPHLLNVRVMDNYGNWSPVFSMVVVDTSTVTCIPDTAFICLASTLICPGSPVTFTACVNGSCYQNTDGCHISSGGIGGGGSGFGGIGGIGGTGGTDTHTYQWKVNGVNTGTNSPVFIPDSLPDGAMVTCEVLTQGCTNPFVTSPVVMTVQPYHIPSISIGVSANPVCEAAQTDFWSLSGSAGNNPVYEWYRNDTLVGTNDYYYSTTSLQTGDHIYCVLTAHDACNLYSGALSNTITMSVLPAYTPAVYTEVVDSNLCAGADAVFTAHAFNPGYVANYYWYVNDNSVPFYDSVFAYNGWTNGDAIICWYNVEYVCASQDWANSESIALHEVACKNDEVLADVKSAKETDWKVSVYPNPSTGKFYVSASGMKDNKPVNLKIYNATGAIVFAKNNLWLSETTPTTIDVNGILAAGVYWLRLYNNEMEWKKPLVISGK